MCNISITDSALNFLVFSYFGITFENDRKEIIEAAAKKGYNDATMRGALVFKKKFDKNDDDSKYISEYKRCEKKREAIRYAVKINAVNIVIKSFDNLKECIDFNRWHKDLCDDLVNTIDANYDNLVKEHCNELYTLEENHDRYFTYGNAQKFVNMFLKNLYVLTLISSLYKEDKNSKTWYDEYEWIINKSSDFHIPIDSYVLEYTKIKTEHPWSKINEYTEEYKNIQVQIKNNNINFSNENECWIWQAKLEGLKDKKAKLIKYNKNVKDNFLEAAIKSLETEIENYKNNNEVE